MIILTFRSEETGRYGIIYAEQIISQHMLTSSQKMSSGANAPCEEFEGFDLDWLGYFPPWLMP
jgi:hypothetical protein